MLHLWHQSFYLLISVILGGAIGWERVRHERPAGLRTHILVCLGSALITLSTSTTDIGGRVAAQIVTGVGFIGAGTIMRSGNTSVIRGLTTAASLWTTAGIGIAVGMGQKPAELAGVATLLVLFTLAILSRFEAAIVNHRRSHRLVVFMNESTPPMQIVEQLIRNFSVLGVQSHDLSVDGLPGGASISTYLELPRSATRSDVVVVLNSFPSIVHHDWID